MSKQSIEEVLRFAADVDIALAEHKGHMQWLIDTYNSLNKSVSQVTQGERGYAESMSFLDSLQQSIVAEWDYIDSLKKTKVNLDLIVAMTNQDS